MAQPAVVIPEKIYFKIGEVCDLVGVQPHVLRYWETEFPMLSPQKNRSGQRSYRRRDVEMALRIKELLYDEMFTIAGAKKKLQTEVREGTKLKIVHPEPQPSEQSRPAHNEPSLFDDDLEIADAVDEIDDHFEAASDLSTEQRHALKALATNLLELRELLKTPPDRAA
ncbi:MAG TPA: MerR family transcriptional regulator [Pyrinomonadaceae bacterium]|jgi:DNA-binding transcriptional MerR regulator|nr:MerR family transcriptional regulator [Pyrinomonadaceae bacterium]